MLIIYLGKICITSLLAETVNNSLHSHQEWCPEGLPKIRNPESGIKKKKEKKRKFVDMKISTKVKVTWETVFIALENL